MSGESAAARIMRGIHKHDANAAQVQIALGTIKSVNPFRLSVDGMSCEFQAEEVLVNDRLMGHTLTGNISGNLTGDISGSLQITGSGSVGSESGAASIDGIFNGKLDGSSQKGDVEANLDVSLRDGDRVVVLSVGNGKWVVICKVVEV